jgi:hypothetical protein
MTKVLKTVARAVLTVGSKVWTVTEGDGGTGEATGGFEVLAVVLLRVHILWDVTLSLDEWFLTFKRIILP